MLLFVVCAAKAQAAVFVHRQLVSVNGERIGGLIIPLFQFDCVLVIFHFADAVPVHNLVLHVAFAAPFKLLGAIQQFGSKSLFRLLTIGSLPLQAVKKQI